MIKAQFIILALKNIPVNALLLTMSIVIFLLAGCGFQLNRNRVQLPDNARSLSIGKIENHCYVPRLNLHLRDLLTERFARNSVALASAQNADLVLSFQINTASFSQNEYSLSDSQSWEFLFSVGGNLTVLNNSKQSKYLNQIPLVGTYSIKTEESDLTREKIEEGRYKALTNLSDIIVSRLTQNF